jgi:hypothetical protein
MYSGALSGTVKMLATDELDHDQLHSYPLRFYRVSINDCLVKPALEKNFTVPLF